MAWMANPVINKPRAKRRQREEEVGASSGFPKT